MPFFYFPVFFGFRIKKDYTNNCFFPFAFCSTVFLYLFQILLRERILPDAKTDFWKSHFFLFKSVILFFTFVFYFRFLLLQSKAFHEDRSHRNHFLTFCLRQSPDYWHQKKILLILILIRNQCSTRKTGTARGVSDILVGYSRRFFAFLCIITSASVSARKEKRRLLLCIFIILQPIKKLNSWHTHRAV